MPSIHYGLDVWDCSLLQEQRWKQLWTWLSFAMSFQVAQTVFRTLFIKLLFWIEPTWLRHCATSRKVAGSIPDRVIGFSMDLILPACRSAAARLLRLWFRIPVGAWMFVCCECCVLSGRGLCDELITRPEESYRLWRVVVCDLENSWMRRLWVTGGLSLQKQKTKKKQQQQKNKKNLPAILWP